MSTRCNIHFCYGDGTVEANVYRHSGGYPDGVLPDLDRFFTAVEEQTDGDTRFGDPAYLAAKFVVWQAAENAWDYDWSKADGPRVKAPPLKFLSVGIVSRDAGDGEFVYTLTCSGNGRPAVTYAPVNRY